MSTTHLPIGMIRAAGAVVWRGATPAREVLLIHRPKQDDWSFPKGKLKTGEHVIAGALREVAEETGMTVTFGPSLPAVHYLKQDRLKRVDYWSARIDEADLADRPPVPDDPDEVDRTSWLPIARARRLLTYPWDVELLESMVDRELSTTPLLFLRSDHDKPWDDKPRDNEPRAESLADVLAGYRPTMLISAPCTHCVRLLEPYAERNGVPVHTEPALADRVRSRSRLLALTSDLIDASIPAAICGHGVVLPRLAESVCNRYGPHDMDSLRDGRLSVLQHTDRRLVAVENYDLCP